MLGHHDRQGLFDTDSAKSWNAAHPSRGPDGGCSQAALRSTGGDGLFYCFAAHENPPLPLDTPEGLIPTTQ